MTLLGKCCSAVLFAAVLTTSVNASASAKNTYPIYKDYSIPKPDKPLNITADDLKLTDEFLVNYPEGLPGIDQATLYKLYDFYKNDPDGRKEWQRMQGMALKCIPTWDMGKLIQKRYVYSLEYLRPLGKLYMFTGNELVSDFIRGHMAKAASLPIDFWIHAELRKFFPERPQGYIETSYLNQTFGTAITAVRRNMSKEEIEAIETAWYEKGHKTALNWLTSPTRPTSNFLAVISTGALYSSKYFKDAEGERIAIDGLKCYLSNGILSDGSDYEGWGYFDYPVRQVLTASAVMTREQIEDVLSVSGIRESMKWRVAGMLFGKDKDGHPGPYRLTFGDNAPARKMWATVDQPVWLLRSVYRDGLSEWIRKTYRQHINESSLLVRAKFPDDDVAPVSPEEAGIPLLTTFESGDCYIRSGWGDDDMVLALKARNGNKDKKSYPHSRPEINSIMLGAFGEYLICSSASASYRSPIRKEHDVRTWRANVMTVDGQDQLFPHKWQKKLGTFGYPTAQILRKEILPDGEMILSNEARDAYAVAMKQATRTVRYIPQGRFYIVEDVMAAEDGEKHHFDYRYFINNLDDAAVISGKPGLVRVQRPNAELYIALHSSEKMSFSYKDAYLHGPSGRDYDPDGPQQGKLGSAKGLVWSCDASSVRVTAVLVPVKPGSKAPKIKFGKGSVTVDGKICKL